MQMKIKEVMAISVLVSILICCGAIIAYLNNRKTKMNDLYDALCETVSAEIHPEHQRLCALTTFRQFRKDMPEFQLAVLNKLKTYDIVPTAIEKTMSPEQLYKTNNPLWMTSFSVEAIRIIFILEEKLGRDTVADDCINEFMIDCKHGMKPITALEKQLRKLNSLERT